MTSDPISASTPGAGTTPLLPGNQSDPLGRDTFLSLLVTQLTHQNPLEPQADGEFLAQLAQFTSLEKLEGIESELSALRGLLEAALTSAPEGEN